MPTSSDWTWTIDLKLPTATGAGCALLEQLVQSLEKEDWPQRDTFGIRLAVEEALVNAIRHGNNSDSSKTIDVSCRVSPQRVFVEIVDQGAGFNPADVPDCTQRENWERASGRGIMLMRNYMSRVEYHDGGKRVVLEKTREPSTKSN